MEAVGKLLPQIFKRHMRREDAHVVQVLEPFWPRVAGKEIAEHSKLLTFEAGTLTIGTSCPSWAAQLRPMADELRAAVNIFLGCSLVKTVHVRFLQNLERVDLRMRPDDFAMIEARKSGAAVTNPKFNPPMGRIIVRPKVKTSPRGEKRLD